MSEYTAEDLAMYNNAFKDAVDPNAPVPEATYTCRIDKAEMRHNKYFGVPELAMVLVIDGNKEAGGRQSGRWLRAAYNASDKGMPYLFGVTSILGFDGEFEELAERCDEFLDLWVEAKVEHNYHEDKKKTYVNTYIKRLVPEPADAQPIEDNTPF